ncbi:MAG: hypothetical protein KDN18_22985 [Verrucomicrobiae bacterium]|nr:hypothetical protein [Verrucomicrobiae bacterium]
MKKALGFLFAVLALSQVIAVYPIARILLESLSGDNRTQTDASAILVALSAALPLLVGFSTASICCFRRGRQTGRTKENGI